ncbi:hypothetical protein DFH08DRAFT_774988 [Mycena albidolilacea]|uniref:Glycosyl transferase CAP10 domain-containing protein n=1 Tax=Mycena albidolilacea TaxID=1033008 RepID=A0AAD7EVW0_9AGAR|nr:hypothetical protein DFH08DRAFT_774988 [Mycena albidolilacea]
MDAADARFRAKLARQSPDLPAAVAEYTRRYARAPPRGFDKWYDYARAHGFVMVDEFDVIAEDLAPFWEMGGRELRERARVVGGLPSVDLVRVRGGEAETVKGGDGRFVDSEVSARAAGFKAMLTKFVKELPDMDFPINAKAEGRVVVPWEHKNYPNTTKDAPQLDPATFRPDWAGNGSVWDAWRRTCAPAAPARRLYNSISANAAGGGGARDWLAEAEAGAGGESHAGIGTGGEFAFTRETGAGEVDFCQAPSAHYEQGHFFSDWRVLPTLVPVFSPARARGFGDIRIPSHYYYGGTRRYTYGWDPINLEQRPVDAMEVPWEAKRDVVWWRGASTGGGSSPPGFGRGYQRHRFLRMSSLGIVPGTLADAQRTTAVTFAVPPQVETVLTQSRAQEPYTYSSSSTSTGGYTYTNTYTTVPVPLGALNADVMDTAFTKAVVPIGAEHRFGDSTELGVAWGYKYLLDLDGMGYSGRFMAFLASDSVPVKATVYDEFFSGWIEPWVHYIPLSATYSEIYNIVAYFSGPPPSALRAAQLADPNTASATAQEEGDRRLRRIARAGKQWKQTIGRTVDMEIYVYRLALEYARLWADDREAMSYTP